MTRLYFSSVFGAAARRVWGAALARFLTQETVRVLYVSYIFKVI